MKIIKPGDLSRISKTKCFVCLHCGCEFLADEFEYVSTGMCRNMHTYGCTCPTCGKKVYLEE